MPTITNATQFDPNTPPTSGDTLAEEVTGDEDTPAALLSADAVDTGNRAAMADQEARDWRSVVGTTAAVDHDRGLRLSEDRAQAERQRAESKAASGGEGINTALRSDVGEAVSEILRLHDIARQASALAHRATSEVEALDAAMQVRARLEKMDELLAAGWDASESKQAVPPILAPLMRWDAHERPTGRPVGYLADIQQRINAQHAERASQRVLDTAEQIDASIVETGEQILARAASAADVLTAAGLTVDATADDVIDAEDTAVSAAWRGWRSAVQDWGELQSTRRWVFVALASGLDPNRPTELVKDPEAERASWQGQYQGSELVGVAGAHGALAWWLSNGRPQAAGVAYAREAGVA